MNSDMTGIVADFVQQCHHYGVCADIMTRLLLDLFHLSGAAIFQDVFYLGLYLVAQDFPNATTFELFALVVSLASHNYPSDQRSPELLQAILEIYFVKGGDPERQAIVDLLFARAADLQGPCRF